MMLPLYYADAELMLPPFSDAFRDAAFDMPMPPPLLAMPLIIRFFDTMPHTMPLRFITPLMPATPCRDAAC